LAQTPAVYGNGLNTRTFNFGGTITLGGTAQLILPPTQPRTYLIIQNTNAGGNLNIGIGPARATATVAGGIVTGIAVTNAGMGYTKPPNVKLFGGLVGGLGFPEPGAGVSPTHAQAHAVLSGATIGSIVVDNGGSGYTATPYVYLENHPDDITGSLAPSATAGFQLLPGGSWVWECSTVTTDAVSIFGATTSMTFECLVVA